MTETDYGMNGGPRGDPALSPAVARVAAALVALLAVVGLVLEYQSYIVGFSGRRLFWRTVDFFSFFTIEANILVAAVALAAAFTSDWRWGIRLRRPVVTGAVALYAVVAGATYFAILRYKHHPVGLALVADNLLHYIVPLAFLALWLGALPKGGLRRRDVATWMLFPAAYFAYALARGPGTGFSPYPFLDAAKLGYGGVALNIAALVVAFLGVGAILVALDRGLAVRRRREGVPAE